MRFAVLLVAVACKNSDPPRPVPTCVPAPVPAPAALQRAQPPPSLPASTIAWTRAETDSTPINWDAAADALAADIGHCASDCFDLAKRELKARSNAIVTSKQIYSAPEGSGPAPIDPRIAGLVAAMDDYIKYADPSDPDVLEYAYSGAAMMSEYRHDLDAIARCEAILRDHRDSEIAERTATELLVLLDRSSQTADLRFWVTDLLADSTFLEGKPVLRETLLQLRTRLDSPR